MHPIYSPTLVKMFIKDIKAFPSNDLFLMLGGYGDGITWHRNDLDGNDQDGMLMNVPVDTGLNFINSDLSTPRFNIETYRVVVIRLDGLGERRYINLLVETKLWQSCHESWHILLASKLGQFARERNAIRAEL